MAGMAIARSRLLTLLITAAIPVGATAQSALQPGAYEVRFLHGDTD